MVSEELGEEREYQRRRALKASRICFAKRRWPRLAMGGAVLLTGGAGFIMSFVLLRVGVVETRLRYPLAALFAWAVFLGLMRLWAEFERR